MDLSKLAVLTYCRTLILAAHLSAEAAPIPAPKVAELVAARKKLGRPAG